MGYWGNVLFTGRTQGSPLQEPISQDHPVRGPMAAKRVKVGARSVFCIRPFLLLIPPISPIPHPPNKKQGGFKWRLK